MIGKRRHMATIKSRTAGEAPASHLDGLLDPYVVPSA